MMEMSVKGLFYPDRAEKISDNVITKIFVKPPLKKSLDDFTENTILEGERGTGKTIMLKHVELNQNSMTIKGEGNVFCIYIPLSKLQFDALKLYKKGDDDNRYYTSLEYFNVFCLTYLVNHITNLTFFKDILKKSDIEEIIKEYFDPDLKYDLLEHFKSELKMLQKKIINKETIQYIPELTKTTTIIDFVELLNSQLDSKINFMFLLDDFFLIPRDIQKYIISVFTKRSKFVTYKIATINSGIETECHPSGHFEYTHDYSIFNSNPLCAIDYAKSSVGIDKYFSELANRQLEKHSRSIESILGGSVSLTDMVTRFFEQKQKPNTKTRIRFFGFTNIVALSSGNARTFIRVVDDIFQEAINRGYKLESNEIIDKSIQNDRILERSKRRFESIGVWPADDAVSDELYNDKVPVSMKLIKLVGALGEILNRRLHTSFGSNATICFQFSNPTKIKSNIKALINEGLKESCIQLITLRKTKDGKGIGRQLALNGMLAPSLNLFPLRRWPQPIHQDDINRINMSAVDDDAFDESIREFVSHAKQRITQSEKIRIRRKKDKKLDDFFG